MRQASSSDREHIERMLKDTKAFSSEERSCALEMFDQYLKLGSHIEEYVFDCICHDSNVPLGFVCYGERSLTEGVFDLYWIVVDGKYRSQGLGKQMIRHLDQRLRTLKARMLLAETSTSDSYRSTRIFYKAIGFCEVSRVQDLYRDGEDLIIYAKRYH